jgi:hypothetical protein
MHLEPEVVFFLFGAPVTVTVVTTWGLMAALSGLIVAGYDATMEH